MFPSFSSFPAQRELITGGDKDDKKKRKRNKRVRKEYNEYSTKYDFPKAEIPEFELEASADFRIDRKGNSKILKYQEIRDELVPIYKRPRYIFDDNKKNPERRLKYREYNRKESIPMIKYSDLNVDMVPDTLDEEFIPLPHDTVDAAPPNTAEATSKVLEFNHQLKKDPQNTKLWLEFINFQSTIAGKNATAKKLSIFERAMENNNDPVLVIKYMELLAEVEDEKDVLKQWDHVLSNNPTLVVWISYIDYKSCVRFQYTEICELYAEALYNFSSDGDEPMLHLFYRLCWLQRQCGYEERGIGMFQALIEYNIFPDEDIAEFWDSENPRFGEVGSRTYQFLGLRSDPGSDRTNQENVHSNNWQQKETVLMRKDWLPLRKSIHEAVDDPFRTVLFEDVQPYLFVIKSAFAIQQLISQFLRYVGFPFAVVSCSNSLMSKDWLLNDELLQSDELWLFGDSPRNFPILSQYKLPSSLFWKCQQWPTIIDTETIRIQSKGKLEFIFQLLEQGSVYYRSRTTPKCYGLLLEFLWSKQE